MVNPRPNPETLLRRAQDEERDEKRGRLKIYLGAAPGVGKTYTMLHDALEKRAKNLDVVVGIVESHGREEIDALLKNLEVLPRQTVHYRDTTSLELDLHAVLQRQPGLILIDEMAHQNTPGLQHAKRWQDIKELLERGIDVYTTLNVQHIESLNDDIVQIIQAPVTETVPDSIIERADSIELIDLPPEELLKRLQEGKVYIAKQAEIASEHFFRKGNLIALRELALRTVALKVSTDVITYRQGEGITKIWPTRDKIMVCVGPRFESLKLIRTAKRLANSLHADWTAVYVDTPNLQSSASLRNHAIQNLRLAAILGAETHVLTGDDIVRDVLHFAREQNATQIIIGKRIFSRWRDWFRRNFADELLRYSDEIDVYIITEQSDDKRPKKQKSSQSISWKAYIIAIGVITFTTLLNTVLHPILPNSNLVMMYLLGVTLVALLGQIGPSLLASLSSVLGYAFFFTPPSHSLAISDIAYFPTLVIMLLVAQIISHLTIMTRRQAQSARLNQHQTTALYSFSRQLTTTRGVDNLLSLGARYIANTFNSDVIALMPTKHHHKIKLKSTSNDKLDQKDKSIAQWVFEMGQAAGIGTDTLSSSDALYMPILSSDKSLGVLRIKPKTHILFSPEQMELLGSCINQLALALVVDHLQEKEKKEEIKLEMNKARSGLLQIISNNLHRPLKIVIEFASKLKRINNDDAKMIGKDIREEIEKLQHFNNNILNIIELEFKQKELKKIPCSIKEVINVAIKISTKGLQRKRTHIHIPETLPLVSLNKKLIQDVFINLFDNVMKFTPVDSPIFIYAEHDKDHVLISIEDFGPGISIDEKNKLFETFYRGKQLTSNQGLGLGLSICKKIIEAHNGKIWTDNIGPEGATFRFTLPFQG